MGNAAESFILRPIALKVAGCADKAAIASRNARIRRGSRRGPATEGKSCSHVSSRYEWFISTAASCDIFKAPGQPPRTTRAMSSEKSRSDSAIAGDSPRNNAPKETSPVESPVSCSVIVRMRKRRNRPAPEWRIGCSSGVAEPVNKNCPACRRRSTSWRTSFHTSGTTCHSSSKRGVSPCSAVAGCSRASTARLSAESR